MESLPCSLHPEGQLSPTKMHSKETATPLKKEKLECVAEEKKDER
jgi:hypothetical protein